MAAFAHHHGYLQRRRWAEYVVLLRVHVDQQYGETGFTHEGTLLSQSSPKSRQSGLPGEAGRRLLRQGGKYNLGCWGLRTEVRRAKVNLTRHFTRTRPTLEML